MCADFGDSEWQHATECYEKIITRRPWTGDEFPIHAAWLAENDPHLNVVVAATNRPRFYAPWVAPRDELGALQFILLPLTQCSREVAGALHARAMFRLGAGKVDEAWQDLLACHRLARLVWQGPCLVNVGCASGIETDALRGDAVLAHEAKLSAEQSRRFAAEWRSLPAHGQAGQQSELDGTVHAA